MNNKDLKHLCELVDGYEFKNLADGWAINRHDIWRGVRFSEIIADVERYGLGKYSWSLKDEIIHRVDNYCTFGVNYGSDSDILGRLYLHNMESALKIIDAALNLDLCNIALDGMTADEIADMWGEQEKAEKEEEARQDCIDYCAKFIYGDGLVDTLDEAYELAEKAY